MGVEVAKRRVEVLHAGVTPHADTADGPAFVTCLRKRAMATDFALMELFCEFLCGARLSQPGVAVDGDGAFGPVAVLAVGIDDVPEIVVQCGQLRCFQWPDVV